MLVPAARAQSITFYDTMSGPSWLPWYQNQVFPKCKAEAHADLRYTTAGTPETLQRIKAAGANGDIDLLFLAPDKLAAFKQEKLLEDLRPYASVMPNMSKTEPPDNAEASGVALDGTGAPLFRYRYALIYNSDSIKSPPKSWKELYERRDEWKGRISYIDPRAPISGAGRFFVASFLRAFGASLQLPNGVEDATWAPAWQKLKELEQANAPKHAESAGALTAQLATGEILIGFHATDFVAYAQKIGTLPPSLRTVLLKEGVPGGAGYFAIAKNVPSERKQAAARFINCALSDEVQLSMVKEMLEFPGTAVWDKVPAEARASMPTKEVFDKVRAPDPSADALKHISDVWAKAVGY
jgi:putative spermidine/putrescine transport system substrate-binding protein